MKAVNHRKDWKVSDIQWIRDNAHLSIAEMAQHFGRSYSAMAMARCTHLPRKFRRPRAAVSREERARIIEMNRRGINGYRIAILTGRSKSTVWHILKEAV